MGLDNFRAACERMKAKNETVLIAATQKNISSDPERQAVFNEVFGEVEPEPTKSKRKN